MQLSQWTSIEYATAVSIPAIVHLRWTAIIDKGIFLQIQTTMASKKPEITHPRTIPSTFLFSGFIFCSCGHVMIGRSAKSHQYYYYTCNGNFKQGTETCAARALPKDRLERAIVQQIREKVLNNEWVEELVELVNKELDSSHTVLGDRLDAIDAELNEAIIRYTLPVPPQGKTTDRVSVLPIDTPSGPWGTVPELLFEKKALIPAIQRLIVSYLRSRQ